MQDKKTLTCRAGNAGPTGSEQLPVSELGQMQAEDAPGMRRLVLKIPDYPDASIRTRLSYYAGDVVPDLEK